MPLKLLSERQKSTEQSRGGDSLRKAVALAVRLDDQTGQHAEEAQAAPGSRGRRWEPWRPNRRGRRTSDPAHSGRRTEEGRPGSVTDRGVPTSPDTGCCDTKRAGLRGKPRGVQPAEITRDGGLKGRARGRRVQRRGLSARAQQEHDARGRAEASGTGPARAF